MKVVNGKRILRTIFEFHSPYKGLPNFIHGNVIRHALGMQINTSVGIFCNLHPLNRPNNYEDFFLIRKKKIPLKPNRLIRCNRYSNQQDRYYTYWSPAVSFDFLDPPEDIVDEIKEKETQLLQLGGLRNCGMGIVSLYNYLWMDLEDLISLIPEKATHITLISPIWAIPRFCQRYNCRHVEIPFWNNGKCSVKRAVAQGQFFRLKKEADVKKIGLKGILRKSPLGTFGLGEFQVMNWGKRKEVNV